MLTVWGRRSSANVQKVMWLIGELSLVHTHIPAGGAHGGLDAASFLAMNPNGRVPVIDDDGVVVWESNAILRYLAARYGGSRFWPGGIGQRAHLDQWMDWSATTFQPDMIGLFWNFWRTPVEQRNPGQIAKYGEHVARDLDLLDRMLAVRPFIAGNEFTVADIPSAVHLYRYYTMGVSTPRLRNVEAWYRRMQERSAYREHVMVSYAELQGKLDF